MDDWNYKPAGDLGLSHDEAFKSLKRESGLMSTALHWTWWSFVRAYLNIWHRLKVVGRENLPRDPPFVLVANHASHLDALVLAAPLDLRLRDQIFPIAAGDVFFTNPAISAFAALMLNALPMWRKQCGPHALQELRRRLVEEPCCYILFPEGQRSRTGDMLPFKAGLGMMLAGTNVPVVPCYLHGCFEALRPETRWPVRHPITVLIGTPITFEAVPNKREGWEQVVGDLRRAVEALRPLTTPPIDPPTTDSLPREGKLTP
jgi:1-acyl-sn-glycerol-3-phosphate acyltransferase